MDKVLEIKLYKEIDYDEMWDKWIKEVKALPKVLKDVSITKTDFGYTKSFYFAGGNFADIYGCLFFNEATDDTKPLIVLYHGLGAVMATEGYKNVALNWIRAGYSVLGMDSRLQGGKSIDNAIYEYSNYGLVVFLLWILLKKLAFNCII